MSCTVSCTHTAVLTPLVLLLLLVVQVIVEQQQRREAILARLAVLHDHLTGNKANVQALARLKVGLWSDVFVCVQLYRYR